MDCSGSRNGHDGAQMTAHASSPWLPLGFFAAMAAAGPLLDGFWQSLLTLVFFYAFMGLTWNLMMSAGLLSLGHALFLGIGAYATALLTAAGGLILGSRSRPALSCRQRWGAR